MMKYYKQGGIVRAFDEVDVEGFVTDDMIEMTFAEYDPIINPQKYLSDEEKAQLNRERMPTLTPIEFDIKLNNNGLYETVLELIKDNFEMRIAYNRATFFSRTDSFVDQARIALNLTDEQVDEMWEQAITL